MARQGQDWPDRLLTDREVASILGVGRRTVHRWATGGLLPRVRIEGTTRFRSSDIRALIAQSSREDERLAVGPGVVTSTTAQDGRHDPAG